MAYITDLRMGRVTSGFGTAASGGAASLVAWFLGINPTPLAAVTGIIVATWTFEQNLTLEFTEGRLNRARELAAQGPSNTPAMFGILYGQHGSRCLPAYLPAVDSRGRGWEGGP